MRDSKSFFKVSVKFVSFVKRESLDNLSALIVSILNVYIILNIRYYGISMGSGAHGLIVWENQDHFKIGPGI